MSNLHAVNLALLSVAIEEFGDIQSRPRPLRRAQDIRGLQLPRAPRRRPPSFLPSLVTGPPLRASLSEVLPLPQCPAAGALSSTHCHPRGWGAVTGCGQAGGWAVTEFISRRTRERGLSTGSRGAAAEETVRLEAAAGTVWLGGR